MHINIHAYIYSPSISHLSTTNTVPFLKTIIIKCMSTFRWIRKCELRIENEI